MDSRDELTLDTALLSVANKTGIVALATALIQHGVRILSTGGTAKTLQQAGLEVTQVSDVTGQAEIMGGRVKTLHPKIHGGLLGRRDLDQDIMRCADIPCIDLLVVNLYPFAETIANPDCTLAQAIEQIDIGGPAMLRGACKNHRWVTVLTDPDDYAELITSLPDMPSLSSRYQLALKGFRVTAQYDSAISHYLEQQVKPSNNTLPTQLNLSLQQQQIMRYGENPQQAAAFYTQTGQQVEGLAAAQQLQGKPLSYNNLMDADAAWSCMQAIAQPDTAACVIVKHANPCGAACATELQTAYDNAFSCDSTSAFGGIIAVNQSIDAEFAQHLISNQFLEVLLAPAVTENARSILANKANIRVLQTPLKQNITGSALEYRRIHGGYLVQQADLTTVGRSDMNIVGTHQPTEQQWQDLLFAWQLVRFIKSNAVAYAKNNQSLGIGAGQMSRIDSARIAVAKATNAGLDLTGCAMASEAFFPFRDSIDHAHAAGVTAVIQPGGSMHDQKVIDAANEHGMVMVFTGQRHFRH